MNSTAGVSTLLPRLDSRHSGHRTTSVDENHILDEVLSKLSERHGSDVFSEEIVAAASERVGAHLSVGEAVSLYVENILLGRTAKEIQVENERLKRAIDLFGVNEASMVIDLQGTILDVNEKFLEISGYSREEIIGQPTKAMNSGFHPKEFWNDFWKTLQSKKVWIGDICNKRKDGSLFWLHTIVKPVLDEQGNIVHFTVVRQDITEAEAIRRRHADLFYQKIHPLTGLPTRTKLDEELAKGGRKTYAAIHVNRLIEVNTAYGYEAGNAVLIHVAEILKTLATNKGWTAYKLDGADFAILFDGSVEDSTVGRLLEKLQHSEGTYLGNPIPVSFSVGVVTSSGPWHEIMENSSRALQHSKERGEYVIFDENLKTSGQYREGLEMASIVRLALEKNLVKPFFQRIVRNPPPSRFPKASRAFRKFAKKFGVDFDGMDEDPSKKFESLARICDFQEHGSIILPGRFLPVAKKIGKLRSVTQAMIEGVIPVMVAHPEYSFSINLSEEDLLSPSTVDFLRSRIETSWIDPSMLTLEILEEVDPADSERAVETVSELKALGCRIGIDDFGSRYSNFARLRDFEPDYVKIDMKYVRNIHRNERNRILVETIVGYAHKNGIKVIAEGIETPEEQETIVQLGVDYSQGYLFSKPFGSISETP